MTEKKYVFYIIDILYRMYLAAEHWSLYIFICKNLFSNLFLWSQFDVFQEMFNFFPFYHLKSFVVEEIFLNIFQSQFN
jgi:hypothetical protein